MPQRAKPTFRDIAALAGVSVTTVERVLNERGVVSPARQGAVLDAARALGVRQLPRRWEETLRIEIILPRAGSGNPTPFWRALDQLVQRIARGLPKTVILHRRLIDEGDLAGLKAAIASPGSGRQALIIAADLSAEIGPELARAMARGEKVVTLVSDVPGLAGHSFAGIDNLVAGRTAGVLMSAMLRPGDTVLLLQVSDRREEQHERARGFAEMLGPAFPLRRAITGEDTVRTAKALQQAMSAGPVAGIYQTGFTPGPVAKLLRSLPARPRWIAHERVAAHEALLREGLMDFVLDQDAEAQLTRALSLVLRAIRGEASPPPARPAELRIFCRANL